MGQLVFGLGFERSQMKGILGGEIGMIEGIQEMEKGFISERKNMDLKGRKIVNLKVNYFIDMIFQLL